MVCSLKNETIENADAFILFGFYCLQGASCSEHRWFREFYEGQEYLARIHLLDVLSGSACVCNAITTSIRPSTVSREATLGERVVAEQAATVSGGSSAANVWRSSYRPHRLYASPTIPRHPPRAERASITAASALSSRRRVGLPRRRRTDLARAAGGNGRRAQLFRGAGRRKRRVFLHRHRIRGQGPVRFEHL
jgi:hypothetical protein